MVKLVQGNLLEADVEALVNTVNCVGVMGKGIALQFKQAFPENFKEYERACKDKRVRIGRMMVFETGTLVNPKYIINFPTKKHWRGKSSIKDIEVGLVDLVEQIKRLNIRSIAIPPLGAGLGGLDWPGVRKRIEVAFAFLSDVDVLLFEPKGAPPVQKMPIKTTKPKMTLGRALLIRLLELYGSQGYRHTLLEVQKLAYFLQEAGEPLRLRFSANQYGPYAENLNHVLQRIDGHFIRGYGDRSARAEISLLPSSAKEAENFLVDKPEAERHLERVEKLIEGFETPYGMELLSTVHWVVVHEKVESLEPNEVSNKVRAWNERKSKLMKPQHIHKALARLQQESWL